MRCSIYLILTSSEWRVVFSKVCELSGSSVEMRVRARLFCIWIEILSSWSNDSVFVSAILQNFLNQWSNLHSAAVFHGTINESIDQTTRIDSIVWALKNFIPQNSKRFQRYCNSWRNSYHGLWSSQSIMILKSSPESDLILFYFLSASDGWDFFSGLFFCLCNWWLCNVMFWIIE